VAHNWNVSRMLELKEWQKKIFGKAARKRWPEMFKKCRQLPPPDEAHPDNDAALEAHEPDDQHPAPETVQDPFFGRDPSEVMRAMIGAIYVALLSRTSIAEEVPSPEEKEFWVGPFFLYSTYLFQAQEKSTSFSARPNACEPLSSGEVEETSEAITRKLEEKLRILWDSVTEPKHRYGNVLWQKASESEMNVATAHNFGDSLRQLAFPLHWYFHQSNVSLDCSEDGKTAVSDTNTMGVLGYMARNKITRYQHWIDRDHYVVSFSVLSSAFASDKFQTSSSTSALPAPGGKPSSSSANCVIC